MPISANVPYNPVGNQQGITPAEGVPSNAEIRTRANPEEFGAQIGQSVQKLGEVGQEEATKFAGMFNETLATNAETELIKRNAQAKGDFMATEGMESFNALPKYQQTLTDNFNTLRSTLPAAAQRQFDMLGARQNANYNSDAASYVSGQVKKANMSSHASLINAAEMSTLDPDVANNPQRVGEALGTAQYAHGAMMDENHPGLTKDENGNMDFADNPMGKAAKDNLQNQIDHSHGVIWQNAITTQANQDPMRALQTYNEHKDVIPPVAQAKIEAFLNPKIDNYNATGVVNGAIAQAQQQHKEFLTNPSSAGSNPNNLGNVKTSEGAAQGTQNFVNPATPIDGAILTANNLRSSYQGLTLQQIASKWTGESPEKVQNWVNNVSTTSGIKSDAVPNLNDPAQLSSLLKGIATAEKSPKDRALFTDDVINQGVQSSLSGKQASTLPTPAGKNYATNADGSPVSLPDYYASHRDQILAQGDAMAERDFPGNPTYKSMVRERLTQQMNSAISSQSAQYKQDNQHIMKAINGGLTNGKTPMTYQDLEKIPGVAPILDRVAVQDPKFYEGIDKIIYHVAQRGTNINSSNGYDTVLRATEPNDPDHPNRITSQDHLDKLLGRSDGTGINMKDYTDAKPLIESSQQWKDFVSEHMKQLANANGNIDGQGQVRAMNWYNQVSQQKKANESLGEKAVDEDTFIQNLKDNDSSAPHKPSRMEQISSWVKNTFGGNNAQPTTVSVISPTGQTGSIPAENLDKALAAGYKKAQ